MRAGAGVPPGKGAPGEVGAAYEEMRGGWLAGRGAREMGLSVLLRRGMRAWMEAWVIRPAEDAGRRPPPQNSGLASDFRAEVARVLAGMVLAREGVA